ncbi:hypothetical protein IAI18_14905 [Acetobacteraceae bacterium H6797]|nr:hypothetical protein [Acetobacteraceae bacterium H6797]
MSEAGEAMLALGRPVAHAMNNAMMVLLMNLEALARDLPPETPGGRRLERAMLGAQQMRGLMGGLLALARAPEIREEAGAKALAEMRPLLELAMGRAGGVAIEAPRGGAILRLARPALDLALVGLARQAAGLPKEARLTLSLAPAEGGGAWLAMHPAPEGEARAAFEALGEMRAEGDGLALRLG